MLGWPSIAYWVHTPHPFLIRFSENVGIRYYGLSYLLGFVAAYWLLNRYYRAGRSPVKTEQIMDLMMFLVVGVMAGGGSGISCFTIRRTFSIHRGPSFRCGRAAWPAMGALSA